MQPSVDILYITYNRLAYTKITLPALVENAGEKFKLTIVDNGSTDGTVSYLKEFAVHHPNYIQALSFLSENVGISVPTNAFWQSSRSEFLGKIDNDTLVPPGWLVRMLEAHEKSRNIGVIGGFHFNLGYVDVKRLEQRVINIDGVQIVPDAFIGGCCYLFRRSLQRKIGKIGVSNKFTAGWTEYQEEICRRGFINGYLYPLLLVDHFDDPLDPRNLSLTEHRENSSISMGEKGIVLDKEAMLEWYKRDADRAVSGASLKRIIDLF